MMTPERLQVGAAKADITVYEPNMPMLGWGMPYNRALGVHTPLTARAVAIREPAAGRLVVIACAELLIVTDSLRVGVLERLQLIAPELGVGTHDLMLTATHTHSGPNGYSHHLLYNLSGPGFAPRVLRHLVNTIADVIVDACRRLQDADLRIGRASVSPTEPVAFNRSLRAYNRNRDVEPVTTAERRLAVDRELTLARFDTPDGAPIAAIAWFALHGTSVHSDNTLLHPDNKGIAAAVFEHGVRAELGDDIVAIFAQGAAGDVTPNFRYDRQRGRSVGVSDDDFESARVAGRIQAETAARAWRAAGVEAPEPACVDAHTTHIDFDGFVVDPKYADGERDRRTGVGHLGLTFIEGTPEGPAVLHRARLVAPAMNGAVALAGAARRIVRGGADDPGSWSAVQGPKFPFLGTGVRAGGRAFAVFEAARPKIPPIDPLITTMNHLLSVDATGEREWTPNVLPVQIVRLGRLAVVGIPGEPSTVSGRRIRRSVARAVDELGIEHVVVCGYTNGYAFYVTTAEEYQAQRYEGATTLFGQWTLAAYQTHLDRLAARLRSPLVDRDLDVGPPIVAARATEVFAQTWASIDQASR